MDSKVKGTVSSITDFGLFVEIEEGVEGLIHNSHLGLEKGEDINARYKVGEPIEAQVINIDKNERRISLSIRAIKRRQEKEDMAGFMEDTSGAVTFGDLIRQKMEGN